LLKESTDQAKSEDDRALAKDKLKAVNDHIAKNETEKARLVGLNKLIEANFKEQEIRLTKAADFLQKAEEA
jgi:hypothetical protein